MSLLPLETITPGCRRFWWQRNVPRARCFHYNEQVMAHTHSQSPRSRRRSGLSPFPVALALVAFSVSGTAAQSYDATPQAAASATRVHTPEATAEPPYNVLIVGWDGVQRDHLRECLERRDRGCPYGLPGIMRLTGGRGVLPLTVTTSATETMPGWVEVLTGYDASRLGVVGNTHYGAIPAGYSVFEKAERVLGPTQVTTIFLASKGSHTGGDCTAQPPEPWCVVRGGIDVFENNLGENRKVGKRAQAVLRRYARQRFVAFVHFRDPDRVGHALGESSPEYSAALVDLDAWLGRILRTLAALGIEKRTLVYLACDHGFNEGAKQHTVAPFAVLATNDKAVVRGGDRKDVAATVLTRLGIGTGAVGDVPPVDGRTLTAIPSECVAEGQAALDYPGAPDCCAGLTRIDLSRLVDDPPACRVASGGTGDRSGYCTRCGDGVCTAPEQHCNCPADCP
jgi:hypothetical protein